MRCTGAGTVAVGAVLVQVLWLCALYWCRVKCNVLLAVLVLRQLTAELYVLQDVVKSLKQFKEKKEQLQCNLASKQDEIRAKKCSLGELRAEVAKYRGIQVSGPSHSPAVCLGQ